MVYICLGLHSTRTTVLSCCIKQHIALLRPTKLLGKLYACVAHNYILAIHSTQMNGIFHVTAPGLQWRMNFGVNENNVNESRRFISDYNKAVPTRRKLSDGNNVMEEDIENKAEPVRNSVVGILSKLTPSQPKVSVQDIQLIGNISDTQPPPAPSPTPFQSLQPCSNISSELCPSNIAQVLHPSINNLSFHVKDSNLSFQARWVLVPFLIL